jgi:hypothetical protein
MAAANPLTQRISASNGLTPQICGKARLSHSGARSVALAGWNFALTSRQICKTYCDCLDFAALQQGWLSHCCDPAVLWTLPFPARLGYLSQLSV